MVIKIVYHFVDSNLGVEIPSKRKVNRKEDGEVLKNFLSGRRGGGQMTYLGEGRVYLGNQG